MWAAGLSGTAATPVLRHIWNLTEIQCSWLTVSVQLGFIVGTFLYAFLNLSDSLKIALSNIRLYNTHIGLNPLQISCKS